MKVSAAVYLAAPWPAARQFLVPGMVVERSRARLQGVQGDWTKLKCREDE
jgi:hypothetical protein